MRAVVALSFVLAVAAAVAVPAGVGAHGGTRVLRADAGPYHVEAFVTREGSLIDETIVLTDADSDRTVLGAAVAITLEDASGERMGPMIARPVGDTYEVRYPPQEGDGWNVLIEIQGPDGAAAVRHAYRAPQDSGWGGRPGLLLNLLLLGLLVTTVIVLPRFGRWRRGKAPADTTAVRE